MPDESMTPEGGEEPMTIAEICAEHGLSRQTLHAIRARPNSVFPGPVPAAGSTRLRFPRRDVAAYFEANPPRQGRRTDLEGSSE
ncbi:helix-turn-helix domain-containing protein [Streptomyces sp. NPDC008125]|uniref:helix-turn-helix domain-containing protein n=1 Tax=Streptomyces sp. NPDC008125 TaxID=3364811 RepID=UPI0036E6E0C9